MVGISFIAAKVCSIDEHRSFPWSMGISSVIIIAIPCYVKIGYVVSFLVKFCNLNLLRKSRKITVNGSDVRNNK